MSFSSYLHFFFGDEMNVAASAGRGLPFLMSFFFEREMVNCSGWNLKALSSTLSNGLRLIESEHIAVMPVCSAPSFWVERRCSNFFSGGPLSMIGVTFAPFWKKSGVPIGLNLTVTYWWVGGKARKVHVSQTASGCAGDADGFEAQRVRCANRVGGK